MFETTRCQAILNAGGYLPEFEAELLGLKGAALAAFGDNPNVFVA